MVGERKPSGDLFTFPVILGIIIGRIGCFSAGIYEETYGVPTSLPWGMNLGDGISRHPVTLYEIAFLILLSISIAVGKKRFELAPGASYKIFLIGYFSFRFLLDFIKPHWQYFFGLGTIQLTCLAGLIYYYRYIIHPKNLLLKHAS